MLLYTQAGRQKCEDGVFPTSNPPTFDNSQNSTSVCMAWVVYCILNEASSDAFIKTLDMAAEKLNELTGPFDRMKVNTQLILCRYEY